VVTEDAERQKRPARKNKQFALSIIRTFSIRPKTTEAHILGKQLLRSGTSVVAKCGDSLRQLEQTAYLLELLVEGSLPARKSGDHSRAECDELVAIFVMILKRSRRYFLILSS
jgi:hypothetical protein